MYNPERHDEACSTFFLASTLLVDAHSDRALPRAFSVCRFLRARKWDLDASLAMFEASEAWRKDFKVDELYHSFEYPEKEKVDQFYPQYYHKTDNVSCMPTWRL